MKGTMGNRGFLSSLGAGLSLVVAGVIVLAVVSGIVAFCGDLLPRHAPAGEPVTP